MEESIRDVIGLFAVSSGGSAPLLTQRHLGVAKRWSENGFFGGGLFGNLPALVAIIAHIGFGKTPETAAEPEGETHE